MKQATRTRQQPIYLFFTQAKLVAAASDALMAIDEFYEWHEEVVSEEANGDLIYSADVYRALDEIRDLVQQARDEMNALSYDGPDLVLGNEANQARERK